MNFNIIIIYIINSINNLFLVLLRLYTFINYNIKKIKGKFFYKKETITKIYVKDGIELNSKDIIFDYDFKILIKKTKDYNYYFINFTQENDKNIIDNKINEILFILVKVIFNEKKFDITNILKDKNNYFYIENNILFNDKFMLWFNKKFLNIGYDSSCYVEILDKNINNSKIVSNNKLLIGNNNYKIY